MSKHQFNRRDFLSLAGIGAVAGIGLATGLTGCMPVESRKRKPNVIFIITDDQDRDSFGFLEGKALTPNIDRLAKEGVYFSNFYVATSVCTPSRYTCLTGKYASRNESKSFLSQVTPEGMTRVLWNIDLQVEENNVAKMLVSSAYKTGMVGKWHIGGSYAWKNVPANSDPTDPKVDKVLKENQRLLCEDIRKRGFDYAASAYKGNLHDDKALVNSGCDNHNMEWMTKAVLDFVEENKDQPFYMYFAPTLLHWPKPSDSLTTDPRISGEGLLDKPIEGVQPSRQSVLDRVKAAGLPEEAAAATWLDDGIGALMKKLEELGIADDTLIIYFDDHGMESRAKGTCYEGGLVTPTMAYWPGVIKPGRCDKFAQNIDFVPTILDVCNVSVPASTTLDGKSFLPLLKGENVKWRDSVYSEIGYTRAVSTEKWKYLAFRVPQSASKTLEERMAEQEIELNNIKKQNPWTKHWKLDPEARIYHMGLASGGGFFERCLSEIKPNPPYMDGYFDPDQLYDLENDPLETKNLAGDPAYANVLKDMQTLLKSYLNKLPGTFGDLKK